MTLAPFLASTEAASLPMPNKALVQEEGMMVRTEMHSNQTAVANNTAKRAKIQHFACHNVPEK